MNPKRPELVAERLGDRAPPGEAGGVRRLRGVGAQRRRCTVIPVALPVAGHYSWYPAVLRLHNGLRLLVAVADVRLALCYVRKTARFEPFALRNNYRLVQLCRPHNYYILLLS